MADSRTGYEDPSAASHETNQHWFVEHLDHWLSADEIMGRLLVNNEPRGIIRFNSLEELEWLNQRLKSPRTVDSPPEKE